ncbi:hypothetical protein ACFRJ9_13050, partial [Paenarthrobacter sp. NPDC056912]|uniref:hypothetical protein n=1 Tax=Paenarthrobacter sp. NPDC056912 TaxID=3345965 RepID=UPI00366F9073
MTWITVGHVFPAAVPAPGGTAVIHDAKEHSTMVRELSHYVDGQRIDGTSGRFSDVFDPCTGEV